MKRIIFLLWALFLSFIAVLAATLWLLHTTSGAKFALSLVNSLSPVNIQYRDLSGTLGSVNINDLKIDTGDVDIQAGQLNLDWEPLTALLRNKIMIGALDAKNVIIASTPRQADTAVSDKVDWRLPFDLEIKTANIINLNMPDVLAEPVTSISISAQFDKEQWNIEQLSIDHPQLRTQISGTLHPYDTLSHAISVNVLSSKIGSGTIRAQGDVNLSKVEIELPDQKISSRADISDWLSNPSIDFMADIDSPDLSGLAVKLNVTGKGNLHKGMLSTHGSIDGQSLNIKALEYERNGEDYVIVSNGDLFNGPFSLKAGFSSKNLQHSDIQWTPKLPIKNFTLKSSTARISGPWNDLSIKLDAQASLNQQASTLNLDAHLSEFQDLAIAPSTLTLMGGQINLSGSASVAAPFNLKLAGTTKNIRLAKLDPRLPDLDKGIFALDWSLLNDQSILRAEFSDLQARVKERNIYGAGQLHVNNDRISKATLALNAGDNNRLKLELLDTDNQLLAIVADINDLGAFVGGGKGSVNARLNLGLKSGLLEGNLNANSIEIPELISAELIKLNATIESNKQAITMNGEILQFADYTFKNLDLNITGNPEQHHIELQLNDTENRNLVASGDGQWQKNEYQLNVQKLSTLSAELGKVFNQEPLDLHYSKHGIALKPFCLISDIAHLCGEFQKTDSLIGQFDLGIQADKKLPHIQQLGTAFFVPQSETRIKANFRIDADQLTKLELEGTLGKLAIFNQDDESLEIDNIIFTANGENNRIAINFNSDVAGGKLEINGYLNGPFSTASIDANLNANLPDLSTVSPLLIATDIREGKMQIDMHVSGEIRSPSLAGFAKIIDTRVSIPELGITQLINAEFIMNGTQHGEISGTVVSGEGKGKLQGTVDWLKEPVIDLSLEGENLLIADSDSLSVSASPKLLLHYAPGKLDISGNINIDRAFTTLMTAGSNAQLSSDAIIIDDEKSLDKPKIQQLRNIDISTEIINPVRIEGYGVRGTVTGKLRITQKDSGPVLGNGQLQIAGQYKAFGQVLQIESGRLNYINTALDNPALEFYASRQIADVKVGVRVTGRPNALLSRLESTPSMREADILNYLVLGKAPGAASEAESNQLAQAAVALALARSESGIQSVAGKAGLADLSLTQELGGLALSLGKQLSPRLYIGYTMGFIEPINVARVRYMLSSKWAIESEISDETRALIKYRFEID